MTTMSITTTSTTILTDNAPANIQRKNRGKQHEAEI